MRVSSTASLSPWLAAVGAGCIGSIAVRLSTDLFAAGPLPLVVAAAIALPAATLAPAAPRNQLRIAALSGLVVIFSDDLARTIVWLAGYRGLPPIAACVGFLVCLGLGAPLRSAAARAGRGPWALALACFVAGVWLDRITLLIIILGTGSVVAAVARAHETGVLGPSDRVSRSDLGRAVLALPVAAVALGGWVLARAALDPTTLGFLALVCGLGLGALVGRGWWSVLAGLGLAAGTVAGVGLRLPELLGASAYAGLFAFAAFGLGLGPLLGALRPDRRALSGVLVVTALLLSPLSAALPVGLAARAARADAATASSMERLAALRARATLLWAGVGPTGAAALYRKDDQVFVELEGGVADAATRAGAAERFAGTLAACATSDRTRARVGGDDFGLAVTALRAQGFLAIDTAVPDAELARAQAEALPSLARGWLHPSVRLVALPTPAVLRAGPRADAIVEIVRTPFTDGRHVFPDESALRAARAGLTDGGVHVLAVATTTLAEPALRALMLDFAGIYTNASLWLPPEGADTALLLGTASGGALPWAGFESCVAADRKGLESASIRSALDIGALALADAASIRALAPARSAGPGLPASLREPPGLPLSAFATLTADPNFLFDGAPEADLVARAPSRALLLDMLVEATRGDLRDAFSRARALAATPGGARALEPVVRPHLTRARQAIVLGRREGITSSAWETAEAAISTARALAPAYAATRCLEGELAGERGQLARAEEAFAACVELDPTSLYAHDGLARARNSRGDLLGTETALRSALRARPDVWTTSQNLGFFLLRLERYDEAERLLKQASATQARAPSGKMEPAPYLALASLFLRTGRAELALAQAQRAATLGPNPDALAIRADARFELRQLDEAESDYRAALKLDPKHILARGGLGRVQATREQYELAAQSWQTVMAIDPDNVQARDNLRLLAPRLKELQRP
ncbi:MAG: tetratricopeptide repeat protein [Pseudomonadota bacterium]|nr:tetratricopeptide repeat protein [Pseudomonadota bacterium]